MSNRQRLRDQSGRRIRVAESATTATRTNAHLSVDEATTNAVTSTGGHKYRARLIEGDRWGSSGYYPAAVLKRDGPKAWPIGTLSFLDHPTPTEEAERPVRSVKDIAARIVSTPVYEGDGLYADIEVFPHAAPLLEAMADTVGLSVRGEATANWGSKGGRDGWIVETLTRGDSVDFVTKAGAGGKIMSLLESAREQGIEVAEASMQDTKLLLSVLLANAYGGKNSYTYVRDFDPDAGVVIFEVSDNDGCNTYQQSYTGDEGDSLALTGSKVPVVARTVYSAVTVTPTSAEVTESHTPPPPVGQPVAEGQSVPPIAGGISPAVPIPPKEVAIVATETTGPAPGGPADGGTHNVNEAALQAQLRVAEQQRDEAVARATALTEARNQAATATAERDRAIAESRALRANDAGRTVIARMVAEAANVPANMQALIAPRVAERVIGRVPLTEASGEVDMTALEAAVTAAIEAESTHAAAILEAAGAGRVAGLGGTLKPGEISEADFERESVDFYKSIGLSEADALIAAKGR